MSMRAFRFTAGFVTVALLALLTFIHYAWGWNERFLAPVQTGMSKRQVELLLGAPRRVLMGVNEETWDYTRSWSRDARVYFGTNGVVSAIEKD